MKCPSALSPRAAAALLLLALGLSRAPAQMVDLNGAGMSDIWKLIYGASDLDPNGDADGDGASNIVEATAGTDPFDPASKPWIPLVSVSDANVSVSIPCALGKQYQLQSIADLSSSNWTVEMTIVARTGSVVTLTASATNPVAKYLRVAISDVDSDGDGVNDWEEYQLGLDPFNAYSNGQLDSNGNPINDYQYVVGRLASQNLVTVTASGPTATQPDPGQKATSLGAFTLTRGGFPLNAITNHMALGGPGVGYAVEGVDHAPLPRSVVFPVGVSSVNVTVTPLPDTNLLNPVIATMILAPGPGYTVAETNNSASVVIYPSATPGGTGLSGLYFTNSSATYANVANFNPANLKMVRVDRTIDFVWGNSTNPIPNNGYFTVRWIGQVEPQYSETYYFDANTDDGVKLWVNGQLLINDWIPQTATDSIGTINLQGGVRYNIQMDYFQRTGSAVAHLYWYSPSQSRQIIPSNRLYPTNVAPAPAAVVSPLTAVGFVGLPFSYTLAGANSPIGYTANGLPPGLGFNSTSGLISGIPSVAGNYPVALTASNAIGAGASVVVIQIIQTDAAVSREIWTGVPGTNVSDIPVSVPSTLANTLGTLEGITGYGANYGERVRGYITVPVTGNYYFWIAASDSAELWISDDGEEVNKLRRAFVLPTANPAPPPNYGTAPRQWNLQPAQRSPWLSLVAGQKYYVEILHKAGAGTNDNWSVGWLLDPYGTNDSPGEVVPGYVLSRYFPPPATLIPGTLYSANMLALPGIASTAVGSATLRLNAAGTQATLNYSVQNVSPTHVDHIYSDPYLNNPSVLLFDIAAARPQPNGSYIWNLKPAGPLQVSDIQEIINENKAYILIQTPANPGGEISGHFTPAYGSQTFNPPPAPPAWTDDHADPNAAARFLIQATFGPSPGDIAAVRALGYSNWIVNQFSLPPSRLLPLVLANASPDPANPFPSSTMFAAWWQQSVTAPDQLRQRIAFALSEIMVISENGVLANHYAQCLASYYDTLLLNSFGNFRPLLEAVTLSPGMGLYLNMLGNDAGSIITGIHANENYAREDMQLFSIGLNRMWPDGTLVMNSAGSLVPTYSQYAIMGYASAYTGWNYYQPSQGNGLLPVTWYPSANYTNPMTLVPAHHELGTKLLLDNVVLPAAQGMQTNTATTNFDNYCSQDLQSALDSIFNHPNVGPFICRQLIQRLVTSNPSRDYVYRVAKVFNDNGAGVRGDMQAVIMAILLDYEARGTDLIGQPTYGKQREPLLRVTAPARAFISPQPVGGTYSQNGTAVITLTTTNAHRLNNNDTVFLTFTDGSGNPPPPAQSYAVTVTSPAAFTINSPGVAKGTYGQSNNVITVTNSNHGLGVGYSVYLVFTSGGAANGVYQVSSVLSGSVFTVPASDPSTLSGNCLFPKLTGGGYIVQNHTNVTISATLAHGLTPGDSVYLDFTAANSPPDGLYQVVSVPAPTQFTVTVPSSNNQTQDGLTVYPLAAPTLVRSGAAIVQWSAWNMSYTDTGGSSSLAQTPLRAPTVFNFYYPGYMFPGALAAAGVTTPEFQLTSDSTVAGQMNFLQGGILSDNNNTNGLTSFAGGNGSLVLDIRPWMSTNYVANANVSALVSDLNTLLLAGQLSPDAQSNIVSYVTNNFPASSTTWVRDRARATVHQIIVSPDFTIQK